MKSIFGGYAAAQLYLSGENIADKNYIANTNTTDIAGPNARLFTPGQGRAVFGGVTVNF